MTAGAAIRNEAVQRKRKSTEDLQSDDPAAGGRTLKEKRFGTGLLEDVSSCLLTSVERQNEDTGKKHELDMTRLIFEKERAAKDDDKSERQQRLVERKQELEEKRLEMEKEERQQRLRSETEERREARERESQ